MGEDPLSPPRSAGAFAEERREGGALQLAPYGGGGTPSPPRLS